MRVTRPRRWGFPCCGRSPCTYMPTPLPRRDRVGALSLLPHSTAAFPEILPGRLPRFGLSRPAQRSLTFRPACSLNRPRRSVSSEASTDLLPPPPLRLLPAGTTRRRVGIAPTGNRRLCTAHSILTLRAGIGRGHSTSPSRRTAPPLHAQSSVTAHLVHHGSLLPFRRVVSAAATLRVQLDFLSVRLCTGT